jgi:hypothetical protein
MIRAAALALGLLGVVSQSQAQLFRGANDRICFPAKDGLRWRSAPGQAMVNDMPFHFKG